MYTIYHKKNETKAHSCLYLETIFFKERLGKLLSSEYSYIFINYITALTLL